MKKLLLILFIIITSFTVYAQKNGFRSYRNHADRYGSDNPALFGQMLARQYNLNESAIGDLHQKFNRNWGDLALGLEMGNLSKKPMNTVLGTYKNNRGWGNIAKELGIKPGSEEFHRMKRELNHRNTEWSSEWDKKVSHSGKKNNKKAYKKSASKSKGKK